MSAGAGKVWIITAYDKIIYLTVQGDVDINTPEDPISMPSGIMVDRCFAYPYEVVDPIYGTFYIDLMPSNYTGTCNRCGECCGHPVEDCQWESLEVCGYVLNTNLNWHVCQHLVIDNWHQWGKPNNTTCELYATILDDYKGCAYPPLHFKSWMTDCGYSIV